MTRWQVDTNRLISFLSERMYSNVFYAGLKELIVNSLDARRDGHVNIRIHLHDDELSYADDGAGIDPERFDQLFGTIASGHERGRDSRGVFGIGRLAMLSQSDEGKILSYHNGRLYTWRFTSEGYEGPRTVEEKGNGIIFHFNLMNREYDLNDLTLYLSKTVSIPLLKKECDIWINDVHLSSLITPDYAIDSFDGSNGHVTVYHKLEREGRIYYAQNGVGVREESYTGLTVFVDQDFLDVKTDREGFVNDKKYRAFREELQSYLSDLRPQQAFKRMEIDFIQRLMKEFRKYWKISGAETQVATETPTSSIHLAFETSQEQIVAEKDLTKTESKDYRHHRSPKTRKVEEELPSLEIWISSEKESKQRRKIEIREVEKKGSTMIKRTTTREERKEDVKVVRIRGAKPMDLGEEYPIIYFESNPFTFIFNTTHPTFQQLVEAGSPSTEKLAVLFERMMECSYENLYSTEDRETLKARWAEVDRQLRKLFT
jgi:hypothetical protein